METWRSRSWWCRTALTSSSPRCGCGRPLDDAGLDTTGFTTRVVADQAEAERSAFTGSPTILIDGRDPFAEPGTTPSLSCRIYRTPLGPAGAPGLDQLGRALHEAVGTAA